MVKIYDDALAVSKAVADLLVTEAEKAVDHKGRFSVVLSGGSTPKKLYELLATSEFKNRLPWQQIDIFWGDERFVPRDDDRNNAKMALDTLLNHVPVPEKNIHPIPIAITPRESASEYEKLLHNYFHNEEPVLDLILLGLGENGHTASLFPGTSVIEKKNLWVSEVYVEEQNMYRITLTAPIINKARNVVFLVTGANKAEIVSNVLQGMYQPRVWPAQIIKPANGNLFWMLDAEAASNYIHNKAV